MPGLAQWWRARAFCQNLARLVMACHVHSTRKLIETYIYIYLLLLYFIVFDSNRIKFWNNMNALLYTLLSVPLAPMAPSHMSDRFSSKAALCRGISAHCWSSSYYYSAAKVCGDIKSCAIFRSSHFCTNFSRVDQIFDDFSDTLLLNSIFYDLLFAQLSHFWPHPAFGIKKCKFSRKTLKVVENRAQ